MFTRWGVRITYDKKKTKCPKLVTLFVDTLVALLFHGGQVLNSANSLKTIKKNDLTIAIAIFSASLNFLHANVGRT